MKNIEISKISEQQKRKLLLFGVIFMLAVSAGLDGFFYLELRDDNIALTDKSARLENTLQITEKKLSDEKNKNSALLQQLISEQQINGNFQNQIQNIAGTVGVLEKLSKTDPELLKKYSKIYFLNENYIPQKLTVIDSKYLNVKEKPLQIHTDVWPHLQSLLESALAQSVTIQILSAYRSFAEQASLKSSYKVTYGAGTANSFSADQGYSEHQLGTTVDFTTPNIGATLTGFEKTDAYKWLLENAYKYGFTMSYPKENSYYIFEPWHFRFVGVTLATRLHDQNTYFYALDQREIDGYLVNFFD